MSQVGSPEWRYEALNVSVLREGLLSRRKKPFYIKGKLLLPFWPPYEYTILVRDLVYHFRTYLVRYCDVHREWRNWTVRTGCRDKPLMGRIGRWVSQVSESWMFQKFFKMRRLIFFFVLPGKTLSDILPRYKMSWTLSTRSIGIALLETIFLLDRNETVIGHSLGKLFRNFWLFERLGFRNIWIIAYDDSWKF